jgi:hypothetical protein
MLGRWACDSPPNVERLPISMKIRHIPISDRVFHRYSSGQAKIHPSAKVRPEIGPGAEIIYL